MKEHIGAKDNYLHFTKTEYGDKKHRNDLSSSNFEFVDFNNSSFLNCNLTNVLFKYCNFTGCDFTEVRQWNCIYENCSFTNSKFYNATMGVNAKYSDCLFRKSMLNGKGFSFGHNSEYNRCTFEKCDIKSAWILSTRFYECTFSSRLTNVRFSGELEAKVSTSHDRLEFPATFIKCDMSKSVFEELEIMNGAILTDTSLPNQHNERLKDDRIYYPKK